MKSFKKINIGLILTIITIFAVVIYCISVENGRKSSKEEIKSSCEDFINLTNKYATLPEEYQKVGIKNTEVNLNDHYNKMQSEIEQKTISKETANIQKMVLAEIEESQLIDTRSVIVDFKRQIAKITSYQFSGNQVSVVFNSKITLKQKYMDVNAESGEATEKIKENSFDLQGENITLEKKDGQWKIVYADLQYTNTNANANINMNNYM